MATKTTYTLYHRVFGYKALPFPQGAEIQLPTTNEQAEKLSKLGAIITEKTSNGTEAFCPVKIKYKGRTFNLPNSTIAMTGKKRIVETPLIARRGSVKELIQIEDYEFQIRGIALSQYDENDLPQDSVAELRDLFEINEAVELENAFTEIFLNQDNKVVISNIDLPSMQGVSGAQAYSFKATSDTILTLEEL